MPSYSYIAVDAMGKEKKATIDAENQNKAAAQLKKNGLTLISIKEVGMLEKDIKFKPDPDEPELTRNEKIKRVIGAISL